MVDELDLKILELLQSDGRLSFTEVAKRLKVNESTIRKRVLNLQEKRVIKRFSAIIDSSKIGLNTVAIVGIDVEPSMLLKSAQKLCEIQEIKYVALSAGDHMIMTKIWAKDGKELSRLISERIGKVEGVKRTCPSIIIEEIKD
ncbi:MAG: Lrp/AsnC family transcriptional regulator [Nitrososphaerales archaeon]|nr:Lrp/AsnC family transcriptional regulator [Nitrososphaerales archaeon]